MSDTPPPLRIGVLGAASRIAPQALIKPAQANPQLAVVTCVAARDRARAAAFAAEHRIEHVCASYEELIRSDLCDAVYNPLPNGYHVSWSVRALEAGKHVLCEKARLVVDQ